MMHVVRVVFLLLCLTSCGWRPSVAYREYYAHLHKPICTRLLDSDYFLEIYVSARHLDYTTGKTLLQTIARHSGRGAGEFGHAWIRLEGLIDGQRMYIEGGHSGETGLLQAKYFDGVMDYIESGETDSNPIRYLWATQEDGFFQEGSGGHQATFSIRIKLNSEQFQDILAFVKNYSFERYRLTDHQCCSFVAEAAALAGVELQHLQTVHIPSRIYFGGCWLPLWRDCKYREFVFGSPDVLEKSLMQHVRQSFFTKENSELYKK
ncbi:MAG: hypothetical protein H0X51_08940 [Parachlamydiaceae bacterium]|nr:hypothetical protein [Parachlamydiaceae bacterium]